MSGAMVGEEKCLRKEKGRDVIWKGFTGPETKQPCEIDVVSRQCTEVCIEGRDEPKNSG
jgi:hypothetical protein